ncbi:unnamed protein product [Allacma fusca]|uniref:Uncharacterized protein n=1 Tax=Allacma fusca TaxID=39272 RepID=A0A8J2L2G6_9HEXA|nr:unnamed protein product [Allacma fusca]
MGTHIFPTTFQIPTKRFTNAREHIKAGNCSNVTSPMTCDSLSINLQCSCSRSLGLKLQNTLAEELDGIHDREIFKLGLDNLKK